MEVGQSIPVRKSKIFADGADSLPAVLCKVEELSNVRHDFVYNSLKISAYIVNFHQSEPVGTQQQTHRFVDFWFSTFLYRLIEGVWGLGFGVWGLGFGRSEERRVGK